MASENLRRGIPTEQGELGQHHQQPIAGQTGDEGSDVGTMAEEIGQAGHGRWRYLYSHRRSQRVGQRGSEDEAAKDH